MALDLGYSDYSKGRPEKTYRKRSPRSVSPDSTRTALTNFASNIIYAPANFAINWIEKDIKAVVGEKALLAVLKHREDRDASAKFRNWVADLRERERIKASDIVFRPTRVLSKWAKKTAKNYFWNTVQYSHRIKARRAWDSFKREIPSWAEGLSQLEKNALDDFMVGKANFKIEGYVRGRPRFSYFIEDPVKGGTVRKSIDLSKISRSIKASAKTPEQAECIIRLIESVRSRTEAVEDIRQTLNFLNDLKNFEVLEMRLSGAYAKMLPGESAGYPKRAFEILKGARRGEYSKLISRQKAFGRVLSRIGNIFRGLGRWVWKQGLGSFVKNTASWAVRTGSKFLTYVANTLAGGTASVSSGAVVSSGMTIGVSTGGVTLTAGTGGASITVTSGAVTVTTTAGTTTVAAGGSVTLAAGSTATAASVGTTVTVVEGAVLVGGAGTTAAAATAPAWVPIAVIVGVIVIIIGLVILVFTLISGSVTTSYTPTEMGGSAIYTGSSGDISCAYDTSCNLVDSCGSGLVESSPISTPTGVCIPDCYCELLDGGGPGYGNPGIPGVGCFEFYGFDPGDPTLPVFEQAAENIARFGKYISKLCSAGTIIVQRVDENRSYCAQVSGQTISFFNCFSSYTKQSYVNYLLAHETGHVYQHSHGSEYSDYTTAGGPYDTEGFLPTYCLTPSPTEGFAEMIGLYVDQGADNTVECGGDISPFSICGASSWTKHCEFAKNVVFK